MKIYVCIVPGDDIPIAGASFDKRICYNKYWERKFALEEKYHIAVTHTPDECVHEVEIEGSTCLHLCIAGHYSDKEVVGAVIGDDDMRAMLGMMDRLNHQADDEDYFHMEDIMLGLPDVNKRNLNKYCVYLYKQSTQGEAAPPTMRDCIVESEEEFVRAFKPEIVLQTEDDTDEFWNFGSDPRVTDKGLSTILYGNRTMSSQWLVETINVSKRVCRHGWCVTLYAEDEDHALKIASDTLAAYLARKDGIT